MVPDDEIKKAASVLQPKKYNKRRTVPISKMKDIVEEDREETELTLKWLLNEGVDIDRPKYRYQCPDTTRSPCPFVSCRHNLFLEIDQKNGSIKLNFSQAEPGELTPSCALDLADEYQGTGLSMLLVARYTNLTRDRVRQVIAGALHKLKDAEDIQPD